MQGDGRDPAQRPEPEDGAEDGIAATDPSIGADGDWAHGLAARLLSLWPSRSRLERRNATALLFQRFNQLVLSALVLAALLVAPIAFYVYSTAATPTAVGLNRLSAAGLAPGEGSALLAAAPLALVMAGIALLLVAMFMSTIHAVVRVRALIGAFPLS